MARKFHLSKYKFLQSGFPLFFELGKLLPEIKEKYKAKTLHFQKYKKVLRVEAKRWAR